MITLERKKSIAILLCLLGGMVGAHNFYERKYLKGIIYLFTCGLFMIGVLFDLIRLIRLPSVYYLEHKTLIYRVQSVLYAICNFPLAKFGKIISGVGGAVLGFGASLEFNVRFMLIGLGIAAVGMVITLLATRDVMETLVGNGKIMGIVTVCVFAGLLLIAFVVVAILLKAILDIDLFSWFFGDPDDDKNVNQQDVMFSALGIPDVIQDGYGNTYYATGYGSSCKEFTCQENGITVLIRDSDIHVSATGYCAAIENYYFHW